jgi:hypothetical protein
MLRDERTERRAWGRSVVIGLCLTLGLALPAQGEDEPAVGETSPLQVTVVPDPNDQVVILSNGVPTTEVRIRQPEVRTHENLHPIGERTDPESIPTRGPSSQAVDIVYHGTVDSASWDRARSNRSRPIGSATLPTTRASATTAASAEARARHEPETRSLAHRTPPTLRDEEGLRCDSTAAGSPWLC